MGIVNYTEYNLFLNKLKGFSNKRSLQIRDKLKKAIETANRKSEDLEESNKKFRRQGYKSANNAFLHLNQKQYRTWTYEDIIEVNYILLQGQFEKGFRNRRVFIQGSNVSVPSPERVLYHISFLEKLFQIPLNPLEKSILIHFAGVRIHPFIDGNGRTFRLMQNTLLYQECIYPFVISEEERLEYYRLLENASKEWLDVYDNLPRGLSEENILKELYLTPRENIRNFGNFVAENILRQF